MASNNLQTNRKAFHVTRVDAQCRMSSEIELWDVRTNGRYINSTKRLWKWKSITFWLSDMGITLRDCPDGTIV